MRLAHVCELRRWAARTALKARRGRLNALLRYMAGLCRGCFRPTTPQVRRYSLRPVRVGGIDAIDVVDGVGRLWLTLVFRQGYPRRLAFRLLAD
jgi:hypothetical protein